MRNLSLGITMAALLAFAGRAALADEPVKQEAPKPATAAKESKKVGNSRVVVDTNKGKFTIELDPADAPKTCEAFLKLVKEHFYDGLDFHRYEPGFVIQGGDPARKGKKEAPNVVGEFEANGHPNHLSHKKGVVGLARTPEPDSGNSQFYVCIGDATFLDKNYCAFGTVVEGMDVAEALRVGDSMKKVSLAE